MIISPPFLPARGAGQTDEAWLDLAMAPPPSRVTGTGAPEGSFPLSHNLSWHNGVHIQAPTVGGIAAPARAIADGTVIFASAPKVANTNVDDAQNYNPFTRGLTEPTPAWTDNGCVIIEHTTTIGVQGPAETTVVFYSVYMHLSALGKTAPAGQTNRRSWQAGDAIWRKDEVGTPGSVYGHSGQIHFEVCLDAANLQQLIGREPTWQEPAAAAPAPAPAAPTADGRTDSIFGSLYFYLPADTPTQTANAEPTNHLRAAGGATLQTALWVKMTYASGGCTFQSFDERGQSIAALPTQADAEYDLYTTATARHNSLPPASQATSSPSGWYELLRFGRNIGHGSNDDDKDDLPDNAAHWRRIPGPTGAALWADLNAPRSYQFSDADFLPVMGWNCIDDDTTPNDQRCDSDRLKGLIADPNTANTDRMQTAALAARLGDAQVQKTLKRAICKFPNEWDKATTSARYGFVTELQPFKDAPDAWPKLQAHLEAISFDGLPAPFLAADWRVHPREFVGHLRQCGWLSASELAATFPRYLFYTTQGVRTILTAPASVYSLGFAAALARIAGHCKELNLTMRKYVLLGAERQAHFLAQVMLEVAQWRNIPPNKLLMHEWGFGAYSAANPMTGYYTAFYGQGIMQLTWANNYRDYGLYRKRGLPDHSGLYSERLTPNHHRITQTSLHWTGNPDDGATQFIWAPRYDPDIVATNPFNACDSGAFYWVSKHHSGQVNINRVCDRAFTPATVGRINVLVNGGGNGYYERQAYAAYIHRYLSESIESAEEEDVQPPAPKARIRVNFLKPIR